jgi:pathogenesis-related protein 1
MRWLVILVTLGFILPASTAAVESHPDRARAGMVDAHNAVRERVHPDLPPLSWSEQAAGQAQDWADTLAENGCEMRHNPELQDHGQNLFWAGPRREVTVTRSAQTGEILERDVRISVQEITAEDVVESWASEKQWYDYEADACRAPEGESCGHYTQIVWADTTGVGCGMSVCEDKGQIWACDYYPAGNVAGQRPF